MLDHQENIIMPSAMYSERSPAPVSLTPTSRAKSKVPSRLFNLQLAYGFTSNQSRSSPVKTNFTPPPAAGCLKDGFLLPNFGLSKSVLNASISQPYPPMEYATGDTSRTPSPTSTRNTSPSPIRSQDSKTSEPRSASASKKSKHKYPKMAEKKRPTSTLVQVQIDLSPQKFLDEMIQARGYSTDTFCSLDGGYFRKPTPLQLASYGTKTIQAVRTSDGELLKRMLECGISPNACNAFGESFIHMVCRSGDYKLLKILLDAGCSLQVTNDFGRTPLHEACWTSAFDCVELILDTDVRLLHVLDCRGSSPLSYVRQEHWKHWIEFFQSKADRYWAPRDLSVEGKEAPPPLVEAAPHSLPIPDPKNAIPVELATLISAGKLLPEEFLRRKEEVLPMRQVVTEVSMPEEDEEEYSGFWAEGTNFDSSFSLGKWLM